MNHSVDTKILLQGLEADLPGAKAHLTNPERKVYQLEVRGVDSDSHILHLQAPYGRRAPINPELEWVLTFCNRQGAFQAEVARIIPQGDTLLIQLQPAAEFLARRKNVRLSLKSRNPAVIKFRFREHQLKGLILDFGLRGLGLVLDEDSGFQVGDSVWRGHFQLRAKSIRFEEARVAHLGEWEGGKIRLGLEFRQMDELETEKIEMVLDRWFSSRSYSQSKAKEG